MSGLRGLVLASGLVLVIAGFVNGLLLTLGESHQPRLVAHDAYAPALSAMASGEPATAVQLKREEVSARSQRYQRVIGFHTHAINMAALLVVVVLLTMLLPEGRADAAALLAFAAACWLYPLGLLLGVFELATASHLTAAAGAGLALVSLAFLFYRVTRWLTPDANDR